MFFVPFMLFMFRLLETLPITELSSGPPRRGNGAGPSMQGVGALAQDYSDL